MLLRKHVSASVNPNHLPKKMLKKQENHLKARKTLNAKHPKGVRKVKKAKKIKKAKKARKVVKLLAKPKPNANANNKN